MKNEDKCVNFKESVYCFIGFLAEKGYLEFTEDMNPNALETLVDEFCIENSLQGVGDCKWSMIMKVPK